MSNFTKLKKCIATAGMIGTVLISMNAGAEYLKEDGEHQGNLGRLLSTVAVSTLANGGFHILRDNTNDEENNNDKRK